jgi:CDP-diglyceride synthetase
LGRVLVIIAAIIAVAGVLIFLIGKGLGLPRLPGDIVIKRDGWGIFFPIATSILISIILTVVINVILWLLRR